MVRLLTHYRLPAHTQHTHTYTQIKTLLFPVLELAIGYTPVRSAQYSTLPKTTLTLLSVHWRPNIAAVMVVSQQSITHQWETATVDTNTETTQKQRNFPPKLFLYYYLTPVLWNLHPHT